MITLDDLRAICQHTKAVKLSLYVEPLNDAMSEYEIDENVARETHFLAQVAHESGAFQYVCELASGKAYDGRKDLGNTEPEAIRIAAEHGSTPGPWWRGHGLVQITGYSNHLACGRALGLDLLNEPTLLEEPVNAARSAAWFWSDRNLNELADRGDIRAITKRINGGINGLQDRMSYLELAQQRLA